jgi:uncharacterized membrane protein YobD (UPF0266 family)
MNDMNLKKNSTLIITISSNRKFMYIRDQSDIEKNRKIIK